MKLNSLLLIVILLIAVTSFAQDPGYSVKGIVIDSVTQKPVEFGTVTLKNAANQVVRTNVTKNDGSFNFEKLSAGKYTVTIINVGYTLKTIPVALIDNTKQVTDLGNALISPQNNLLKEVSINADKPLIKQEVDRLTYDLQSDPESKVNSVLDMMRKVPLLAVDAEDNILLKGDANYRILINGKTSSMTGKEILRSMPASTIQSIEVITNPPSKYDAEGLAGIINIITAKKIDNGYNGSVNASERLPVGGPGIGGTFTFKQGKFGLTANGGANLSNSGKVIFSNSQSTTGTNPTNLFQDAWRKNTGQSAYFSSELSFEIDSLNLISGQFNRDGNIGKATNHRISNLSGQAGVIESYQSGLFSRNEGDGTGAALNYQLGFKSNKSRFLTFSYRYLGYISDRYFEVGITDRIKYTTPDYREYNKPKSTEQTYQIDYVHPVKKLTIEGGLKAILRTNKSEFQSYIFNNPTGQFQLDASRTNKFNNTQNVFAAYNTYQYTLKNWDFKVGLRAEQTVIDADFISNSTKVSQNYINIVPAAFVTRRFKNRSSLNLGFSQRVQRPGINQLNPYIERQNPTQEATGNPALRPMSGNILQLSYSKSKKATVNVVISYTFLHDLIMNTTAFDPVTNITKFGFVNTGRARTLIGNYNMNYPVTKKWNLTLNTNLFGGWVQGTVNGVLLKKQAMTGSLSVSNGYRFDNGLRLNGSFSMNGKGVSLQGTTKSTVNSSFSLNKDIVKDKLSFAASTTNPFTRYRINRTTTTGPNFMLVAEDHNFARTYSASLNYRFGKLKSAIKKNRIGIVNDDINGQ